MKLKIFNRTLGKQSEKTKLRNTGKIPAAIYERGKASKPIYIDKKEFEDLQRHIISGRLSTTKIALIDKDGSEKKTIIKDIQYRPTTYEVIHLDFEELIDDVLVNVNVPIACIGALDCIGIKLGGVLRTVIRQLKIRCLPKDIPSCFEIDVKSMGLNDTKKLSEIKIPDAVRPLMKLDQVAVIIAKR